MLDLESIDKTLEFTTQFFTELRYLNDTPLISVMARKLQLSIEELSAFCQKWGLKINELKSKILLTLDENIKRDNTAMENVDQFSYLGSTVPGTSVSVKSRMALASQVFGKFRKNI